MTTGDQMEEQPQEEGPRDFAVFLRQVADGQCLIDLSSELHELMLTLREEAATSKDGVNGSLSLELKFKVEGNGVVGNTYLIKRKEPAKRRPNSVFWLTGGGNLTAQNPRQLQIPTVRDVTPTSEEREVEPTTAERDV